MFKRTEVSTALAIAFGGVLAVVALPGVAQERKLERIEITGSAIKRVQVEGPTPVEIYTKKDIERSGATTISELVKNIASIDINDQGELTGNSPSGSGTSNLGIRGLSERNLLVLLNGRRLPINALHDGSGAGAAVDVNNIPLSAIERVDVMKDGGSAIYGADAVAGVINFITRKNFTGLEAKVGYGISSRNDGKETPASIVFGLGDYDTQGFNVLASLDMFKRDAIKRTARDITSSADWRRFGGVDGRSSFHPSGNIVSGTGSPGQLAPCPEADLPLKGGLCFFDFSKSILDSTNGADRFSSMVIGSLKLGADMRGFAELTHSESKDLFLAQPAPGAFVDNLGRTIRARFLQPGPRTTNRESSLLQVVTGLEGSFGETDWKAAAGQGTSKVSNRDSNYLDAERFIAAINNGTIDPTSQSNSAALVDSLRLTPTREGKSVLKFANAQVSGQLMELAGGAVGYAVGVQLQRETLSDQPDADQQAGNVFGSIAQSAVSASRKAGAVFGELSLPITKDIESQLALRHDKFTGNSKTSPKVAVKYRPNGSLMLRGSYAGSFLMPSLKQLFGGQDQGAESVSADANGNPHPVCAAFPALSGACLNFPYQQISGSNPNLRPEIGKTYNVGFVFEPAPVLSLGVDFFKIEKRDEITTLSVESAVANGDFSISPRGEAQVFVTNQNVAQSKVDGLDTDIRVRIGDTPFGRMTVRNGLTYYTSIQRQFEPGGPFFEFNGTFLNPRWRNSFNVNFEQGPWSSTFQIRTTSSMKDSDQPAGDPENETARRIKTYEEFDVTLAYSGIKNMKLSGGIKNALDRQPPYSNEGTQNQYGSLGFPYIYSPRGRFFFLTVDYKFF